MTTRTTTHSRNTRNSRNAGETPGIAFGTQVPSRTAPTTSKRNSDRTASDNRGSLNGIPGDDDFGDNGNGDPDDPDDPDDEEPDNSDHGVGNPDDSERGIQNNLADAIAALARNVQHQGDGS